MRNHQRLLATRVELLLQVVRCTPHDVRNAEIRAGRRALKIPQPSAANALSSQKKADGELENSGALVACAGDDQVDRTYLQVDHQRSCLQDEVDCR